MTDLAADGQERSRQLAAAPVLFEIKNLGVEFAIGAGAIRAVDGASLVVRRGEAVGVVGESGSGKSVMVRAAMNLLPAKARLSAESSIRYDGRDLLRLDAREAVHFWGPEIAMIFQDPLTSLNPVRTVGIQIMDPLRFHLGLSRSEARARAVALLQSVGIADPERRADQYPHELSGGMRQRVGIAIALSCEPKLVIADEPTTALDVTVQRQILRLLRSAQIERNMSMVLISHDLHIVANNTDRVAVMYGGRLVEYAPTAEIFTLVKHRYTEALLNCTPSVSMVPHTRLASIPGRPPILIGDRRGCPFSPRCAAALPVCSTEDPALTLANQLHGFHCHNPVPAITETATN